MIFLVCLKLKAIKFGLVVKNLYSIYKILSLIFINFMVNQKRRKKCSGELRIRGFRFLFLLEKLRVSEDTRF
jgi:hypothetical protein